jgi:hypothetical protein
VVTLAEVGIPLGRVSLFLAPFALFPSIAGVLLGFRALHTMKHDLTVHGAGRAWFGISAGGLAALVAGAVYVVSAASR